MMPDWKIRRWVQNNKDLKAQPGPFNRIEFFVEMNGEKHHFMYLTKFGSYSLEYQLKPFIFGNRVSLNNGMPNSCPIKRDDALNNERLLNRAFNAFMKELKKQYEKVKNFK